MSHLGHKSYIEHAMFKAQEMLAKETHPDQINPLDRDNAMRRRIGENPRPIKPHPDKDSE